MGGANWRSATQTKKKCLVACRTSKPNRAQKTVLFRLDAPCYNTLFILCLFGKHTLLWRSVGKEDIFVLVLPARRL